MHFRQQPHFKRKTRSVRRHGDEVLVFPYHSFARVHFLPDDVAENAALFFIIIVPGAVHFLPHAPRNDRRRNSSCRTALRLPGRALLQSSTREIYLAPREWTNPACSLRHYFAHRPIV